MIEFYIGLAIIGLGMGGLFVIAWHQETRDRRHRR